MYRHGKGQILNLANLGLQCLLNEEFGMYLIIIFLQQKLLEVCDPHQQTMAYVIAELIYA